MKVNPIDCSNGTQCSLSSRIALVKQELVVLATALDTLEASLQMMDRWEESGPFRDEIATQHSRHFREKQIFSCYEIKHRSPFKDLKATPFHSSTDIVLHDYNDKKNNDDMTLLEEIIQLGLNESSVHSLSDVYYSQYHANMVETNPDSIRKSSNASQSEKETQTELSTKNDCECSVNNILAGSSGQYGVCTDVNSSHNDDENKFMDALGCGIVNELVEGKGMLSITNVISSESVCEVSDVYHLSCGKRGSMNFDTNLSRSMTQEKQILAVYNTVGSNSSKMKEKTNNAIGRLEATNKNNQKFLDTFGFPDDTILQKIQVNSVSNANSGLSYVKEKDSKCEKRSVKQKASSCFCRRRRTVKDNKTNNLDNNHGFGSMKSDRVNTYAAVCNAVSSNTGSGMKGKREWSGLSDVKASEKSKQKKSRGIFGIKGKGYRERKLLRQLKKEKKEIEKNKCSPKKNKSAVFKKCIRCLFCGLTTDSLELRGKGYKARKRRRKEARASKKKKVKTNKKEIKSRKSSSEESRNSKNKKSSKKKDKIEEKTKSLESETSQSRESTKMKKMKKDKKVPIKKISQESSDSKNQGSINNNHDNPPILVEEISKESKQRGCSDNCYGVCCDCKTKFRECTNGPTLDLKNKQPEKVDCATNTDLVTFNNERFPRLEDEAQQEISRKYFRSTKKKAVITTIPQVEEKMDEEIPRETESGSTIFQEQSEEEIKMDAVSKIDHESGVVDTKTQTQTRTQISKPKNDKLDIEKKNNMDRPIFSPVLKKEVNRSRANTVPIRKGISQVRKTEASQNRYVTWEVIKERYNIDDKRGKVIRKSSKGNFKEGFKRRVPVKKRSVQFEDFEESEDNNMGQIEDDLRECDSTELEDKDDERNDRNGEERIIKVSNLEEITDQNESKSIHNKKCGQNKCQVNWVITRNDNSLLSYHEPFDQGDAPAIVETLQNHKKQNSPQKPFKTWGHIRAIYNIDERKADTLKHSSESTFREIRRNDVSIERNSLSFPIGKNVLTKNIGNGMYTDIQNSNRVKHKNSPGGNCVVKRVDIKDKDMLIHTYETLGKSDGSNKVERIIHVLPMYEPRETILVQREEDKPVTMETGKHVHFPRDVDQVHVSRDKIASWSFSSLFRACFCCCCM